MAIEFALALPDGGPSQFVWGDTLEPQTKLFGDECGEGLRLFASREAACDVALPSFPHTFLLGREAQLNLSLMRSHANSHKLHHQPRLYHIKFLS